MNNKKYLLFDLDGTVTDPKEGILNSVKYALSHFKINETREEVLIKFIGPPLVDSFKNLYGLSHEDALLAVKKYREVFSTKGIFENKVFEGMEELLRELKARGKVIILATSKPIEFANKILNYFDLMQYFDYTFGSEFDGTRNYKWEVIEYAIKTAHIKDRSLAVMIGDTFYDIEGAEKAKIDSIGCKFGYGSHNDFDKANRIANTVEDLKNILI